MIVFLGRKQRHKPISLIYRELDCVYKHGYRHVFLADDNLTVYRTHAKELAVAVREWNERRSAGKVKFSTPVSIDSARDDELLELWSRAGLTNSFVGIETPNEDSLLETKKKQNVGVDLVAQIEKMLAHGIGVLAGMMVGFDSDGLDIFERQYEFAMASPVPIFSLNTLVAPPGTPLFDRLKKQGRQDVFHASMCGPFSSCSRPLQCEISGCSITVHRQPAAARQGTNLESEQNPHA